MPKHQLRGSGSAQHLLKGVELHSATLTPLLVAGLFALSIPIMPIASVKLPERPFSYAFVMSLLFASSRLFPRIQPCTPVAGSPLHLFFLMSLLIIALPVLHCGRATFLNYISHWESTSLQICGCHA